MGWFVPQLLGVGYMHVGDVLNGNLALRFMILLLVLKFFAVVVSYSSGNAGGIFGPSLFLGAMLGGIVGSVAHLILPGYVPKSGPYALVGMGAAFAGIVRAPMTSVVMIFEITRDYAVIVPLMISNLLSLFISSRLQPKPIYDELASQDGIHLPGEELRESPGQTPVDAILRKSPETLDAALSVAQALEQLHPTKLQFLLVNSDRGLEGILTVEALRSLVASAPSRSLLEVLPEGDFPHVHRDHTLSQALDRMSTARVEVLPVVSRANVRELLGVITLGDVLNRYGLNDKE
jgi:CIC family chloride channel protein